MLVVLFLLEVYGIFIRQNSHCVSALTIFYVLVHLLVLLLTDTTSYIVFFSNIFVGYTMYYFSILCRQGFEINFVLFNFITFSFILVLQNY